MHDDDAVAHADEFGQLRRDHDDRLSLFDELLQQWLSTRTREQAIAESNESGVPMGPIYDMAEVLKDEHVLKAGTLATVDDPELGELRMPNVLFDMSRTPGQVRHAGPDLGHDTADILSGELGLGPSEIESLRERNIVK